MNRLLSLSVVVCVLLTTLSTGEGKIMATTLRFLCKNDKDCPPFQSCHAILKICYKKVTPNNSSAKLKKSSCLCRANEYCHQFFNRCLPKLSPPMPRNRRKPSVRDCKKDKECSHNQYCHKTFKKCLNVLTIPTIASATSFFKSCQNDSNCTNAEFCHEIFKICLVRPTGYETLSTPAPTLGCLIDSDCQKGQYCHNMTHICLRLYRVANNTTLPTRKFSCNSDEDCKISEFCHFLFVQQSSTLARHRRKCSNASKCSQRFRDSSPGVCIPKRVPPYSCVSNNECRTGMLCLKKLGTCMKYKQKGETCLVKNAHFVSPCARSLFCKPNAKGRMFKGKRLARKLHLPKYIRKMSITRTLVKKRKYALGKCHGTGA